MNEFIMKSIVLEILLKWCESKRNWFGWDRLSSAVYGKVKEHYNRSQLRDVLQELRRENKITIEPHFVDGYFVGTAYYPSDDVLQEYRSKRNQKFHVNIKKTNI